MRLEAGISASSAHSAQERDRQVQVLQHEADRLWTDYDWPHLRVERFLPLQAGQRFYDLAAATNEAGATKADLDVDRILCLHVKDNGDWMQLRRGIGPSEYGLHDSALDERDDPAEAWRLYEDEQIEVWPVPLTNAGAEQEGLLRITGIKRLGPFVADDDTVDLDAQMLALYGAANLTHDANAKRLLLERANRRYADLKSRLSQVRSFQLFGAGRRRGGRGRMYVRKFTPIED
jgi:hypothetical protein